MSVGTFGASGTWSCSRLAKVLFSDMDGMEIAYATDKYIHVYFIFTPKIFFRVAAAAELVRSSVITRPRKHAQPTQQHKLELCCRGNTKEYIRQENIYGEHTKRT